MKEEQTIAQFLKVKDFPFVIKDKNGNEIYREDSTGYWYKREVDAQNNQIYLEDSNGYWSKCEYDAQGNEIYYKNSNGYWSKQGYDAQNNLIYYEQSKGFIIDKRPKPIVEMTLQDIANKLGVDVSQIRIKD